MKSSGGRGDARRWPLRVAGFVLAGGAATLILLGGGSDHASAAPPAPAQVLDGSDPLAPLAPVVQPVADAAAPVVDAAAPVVAPVAELAAPVVEAVTPVVVPIVEPVADVVEPLTSAAAPVIDTAAAALDPLLAPGGEIVEVVEAVLEPVVEPVVELSGPGGDDSIEATGAVGGITETTGEHSAAASGAVVDSEVPVLDVTNDAPAPATDSASPHVESVPATTSIVGLPHRPDRLDPTPLRAAATHAPPAAARELGEPPTSAASATTSQPDALVPLVRLGPDRLPPLATPPSGFGGLAAGGSAGPALHHLAVLLAAAAAVVWIAQRVTAEVSWRSVLVLSTIERPG